MAEASPNLKELPKPQRQVSQEQVKKRVRVGAGNFLSQLIFFWVFPFIWVIRRAKDMNSLQLYLSKAERAFRNDEVLAMKWNQELNQAKQGNRAPKIRNAIFKAFGLQFILIGIWKLVWALCLWFSAYWLLKQTITYVRLKSSDKVPGEMYALGFLGSSLGVSFTIHQLLSRGFQLGLKVKSALMVQIFRKSLLLSRVRGGAGNVINLVSSDCQKVADAFTNLHFLWSAVVEVAAIEVISFVELGYSAAPALGIIVILIPIQIVLAVVKSRIGFRCTTTTSKRVHIMSEILSSIKLIKFYAWEKPFCDRISEIRKLEMKLLRQNLIVNAFNFMAVFSVPPISALLALLTYWKATGQQINAVIGFTCVSVYNTLRYPLLMAPLAVNSVADAMSSLRRLDEFFASDEISPAVRHPSPVDSDETIRVENATFKWSLNEESSNFCLKDINFTARKGTVVAIVGDVGSGKSSFLAALLGQMKLTTGSFKVMGSIGYVPQEAWLLNLKLRDNIIFGSPFEDEKYAKAIRVSALKRDLTLMTSGDQTEIGERGINLSGGQRQRISLARCVYRSDDVIFLDDPLSAVDQQVGKHIFTQCIKTEFKNKTVLFVTHQLQYLHLVDDIIFIRNGEIVEHGTFSELMINNGPVSKLVTAHVQLTESQKEQAPVRHESVTVQVKDEEDELVPEDAEPMKLVLEDQSVKYKNSALWTYMRAGSGVILTTSLFIFFFLVHGVRIGSDYWLSQWFSKTAPNASTNSTGVYAYITNEVFVGAYGGACILFTLGIQARGMLFAYNTITKSVDLHKRMFNRVIYANKKFFDTTPLGRILNAFAKHLYSVDIQLADSLMQLLQYAALSLGAVILVMVVMKETIGVFGGAAIVIALLIIFSGNCERKLRDQESLTRSSIFSHLTATLEGLFSIRAYECQERFIKLYAEKIDENNAWLYSMTEVQRWLAFYIDIVTSFIIYTVVICVVDLQQYPASVGGLVLSNVLQLLIFLQWSVRMCSNCIEYSGSIRQLAYYGNAVDQEALAVIENNRPPDSWPARGNIRFSNVELRYQPHMPAVLQGVTVNIMPREKVGIVGRTGSGKSSLMIALLRIVEISDGQIFIDDVDVSTIGLRDLRSRIAVIPQEPVLFVGTIRENVDLFNKNTDEEVWRALEDVHLAPYIRSLSEKLEAPVIENGKNFSVGQRQLFCIARAILSRTQILILDEATASVDLETDRLIQDAIKNNFGNLTVLTIAHRLNTIMDADKLLVMDAGRVVEFALPLELLDNPNGYFTHLLKETGKDSFDKLKRVAEDKAARDKEKDRNSIDKLKRVAQDTAADDREKAPARRPQHVSVSLTKEQESLVYRKMSMPHNNSSIALALLEQEQGIDDPVFVRRPFYHSVVEEASTSTPL